MGAMEYAMRMAAKKDPDLAKALAEADEKERIQKEKERIRKEEAAKERERKRILKEEEEKRQQLVREYAERLRAIEENKKKKLFAWNLRPTEFAIECGIAFADSVDEVKEIVLGRFHDLEDPRIAVEEVDYSSSLLFIGHYWE